VNPATWRALARRFGLGDITAEPVFVARGAMGEIWRLDTQARAFAVKWQFSWAPSDARPADVGTQLAAAAAGIPLPAPVLDAGGVAVAEIDGRAARVYEWADLGPRLTPPVPAARAAEAGRLLGLVHGLALDASGPVDPWYLKVPDDDHWADLTRQARAARAEWAPRLAAARGLITELSELAVPPAGRAPVVCHGDFNPDNVIPAADDGRLMVLDWENSGPLSPDRELGYAVFAFCTGAGGYDDAAVHAFLAGYAAAAGVPPQLPPDFFGTAVATELNVLSVMAERALTEPEHRRSAEEFLADLFDDYLPGLRAITRLPLPDPSGSGGGQHVLVDKNHDDDA
jgi:aminoglycoside phosphotransferase (APT) family kinase protein